MSEDKRVYLLGAGASKASEFRLPVMKGFFQQEDLTRKKFPELRKFIQNNFPMIPIEKVNLEDVITYLDLSLDRFGGLAKEADGDLNTARKQLSLYIRTKLDYQFWSKNSSSQMFEKVFSSLKERDAIITLNYDIIIENTLNAIQRKKEKDKDPFLWHPFYENMANLVLESMIHDIAVETKCLDSGSYLKLHGSIDWYHCPRPNCRNHLRVKLASKSERDSKLLCNCCGCSLQPIIVPPTMNKIFENYPILGVMWSLAHHYLSSSTHVVIISVSFAPSDYHLRWLIKSSFLGQQIKESVIVVDASRLAVKRIEGLTGIMPVHYKSIGKYISEQIT
ncbi:MAG: hypothetical protein ACTSPV_18875 [Candidatus Hodarchaeales archaeon]